MTARRLSEKRRAGRRKTVLVVEDDAAARGTAAAMLRELGYRVLEAKDGSSALNFLKDRPAVDVLLTDVLMPGGTSGPKLAEQARTQHPNLRVLYMSGYDPILMTRFTGLSKPRRLLRKPYSLKDLERALNDILDQA